MSYFEDQSNLLSDLDNFEMMVDELMKMDNASQNNIKGWLKNGLKKVWGGFKKAAKKVGDLCSKNPDKCFKVGKAIVNAIK